MTLAPEQRAEGWRENVTALILADYRQLLADYDVPEEVIRADVEFEDAARSLTDAILAIVATPVPAPADTPDFTSPRVSLTPQEPHGWRPIETAPKDGRLVLVRTAAGDEWTGTFTAHWSAVGNGWFYSQDRVVPRPSHWQPLPPPPAKEPHA